jgi:surface polysaccharide O-acyltransferase-like enzyme
MFDMPGDPHMQAIPQRIHALDNLRAAMMWLGIVLHAAVNHVTTPMVPWQDRATSPVADLLTLFIHIFRMPTFFVLAGFFAALMVERHGAAYMLKNRLRRLGLPFLMFWPILLLSTGMLIMMFIHLKQRGVLGVAPNLMKTQMGPPLFNTMHLWFVYDLIWLCTLAAGVLWLKQARAGGWFDRTSRMFASATSQRLSAWWAPLVLAIPMAILGSKDPTGLPLPTLSFVPNIRELTHFGLFFLAGWFMAGSRGQLIPQLEARCGRLGAAGLLFLLPALAMFNRVSTEAWQAPYAPLLIAFLFNATSWFWSFALIGLFSKFVPAHKPWLAYLSASSYWVYLVHMLGTIGFGVLLFNAPLGALPKMALNIVLTTCACLASYHWLVRRSWIGRLLNGKSQASAAPAAPAEMPQG